MSPLEVGCNWNYAVGGFVPWEIWVWCTHTTKSEKGLWCQNWGQVSGVKGIAMARGAELSGLSLLRAGNPLHRLITPKAFHLDSLQEHFIPFLAQLIMEQYTCVSKLSSNSDVVSPKT